MKKISFLALLLISTNNTAGQLHNFTEIKTAATKGKSIHIIIDFLKCVTRNKAPAPVSMGVFTPNTIYITQDYVAASLMHFTLNNPGFPERPVYEFVRYTITPDNNVDVVAQTLDAVNYTPLSNKFSFYCQIGTGAKIYD